MNQSPSQQDVDSLAHFVQAVADLRTSPFFTDGQTTLGVSGVSFSQNADGTKGPMAFRVPDPRVRDSLIVPFRRMWMTGEPANFERVANIIKRYWPQARPYVDHFKDELKKTKAQFPAARFMGLIGRPDLSIPPEDVVDLWLYCRLTHVGGKPGNGRFTRADYEREANAHGEAQFEYMFMTAVYHVGLGFINLVQLAEQLLERWSNEGLQPGFVFDNITSHGKHETETGDSVEQIGRTHL